MCKTGAHVLFRRCRRRRLRRCSNRLYCFNPPIVPMSLQSILRWPVYTRTSHKRRREKKIGFRKWSPEWGFLKRPAYRFRVKGQKRRFSNTMMSYIMQRMPCEGCYRISIFLAFWCGREKAIQVKPRAIWSNKLLVDSYFFENKRKNSPCWKIWGYVCTHSLPRRVRHAFLPHAWRAPKNVCVGG